MDQTKILVFSTLWPHAGRPNAGLFIRERMFRVGQQRPLLVVAPTPWFPGQSLIRRWKPHFRPPAPRQELQEGFEVHYPRFLCIPGIGKSLDGLFMALGSLPTLLRLRTRFNLIDAHFAYPDGLAAALLGRWLGLPVSITLRGTEVATVAHRLRRWQILRALAMARQVFAVADSLKRLVVGLGADADKIRVVGNAVDTGKFFPIDRQQARAHLGLPADAPVLVSVGGLIERKGFHRVIEVLPALRQRFPGLRYVIVGDAGPAGDWGTRLKMQVQALGLEDTVVFAGFCAPERLHVYYSAADLFVLATRSEGWANVFLEAMACGLPVITTDVGGNAEVVCAPALGCIVPFGDAAALQDAVATALGQDWDRQAIIAHARANNWDDRVTTLVAAFDAMLAR